MRIVSHTPGNHAPRRGFTLVELMLVVLILAITTVIGADAIAGFEASHRPERAAKEALGFFRYARSLAMTTGKNAKVTLTGNTLAVYWMSNGTSWDATPVATGVAAGGQWLLNFNTAPHIAGTAVAVSPAAATTFTYGPLGSCTMSSAPATVSFTYAGRVKTLTVPAVGDPTLQ